MVLNLEMKRDVGLCESIKNVFVLFAPTGTRTSLKLHIYLQLRKYLVLFSLIEYQLK